MHKLYGHKLINWYVHSILIGKNFERQVSTNLLQNIYYKNVCLTQPSHRNSIDDPITYSAHAYYDWVSLMHTLDDAPYILQYEYFMRC